MQRTQRTLGRPRKEQDGISTKDLILHTATGMFLEKGYPSVSMDDVAQKCDFTKATVYYYYKTKADLFTDAMVQLMIRIKQRIIDILSTNASLETQLFQIAKAHIQATVDIDINAFMKEAKTSLSDDQLQLMKEAEDNMYGALEQAIKKAMDKGEIPQSNPRLGALMFVSMLTAGNNLDNAYKETFSSLDDLVTQIVNLFWNGLANENQSSL
ncbi:TetR family transcriptional regulator [Oceanobacillus sp. 143]|uniref:TetR family transcriptional regulator n=1 Tax=Oceanobacillus zhaokaii TaxID=2052660 RepID=A0A345PCD5_9BACI|nr:TetR/AcrR family transcriptional regulator [Oceanobacillus zhaokaii]AXI07665.1 TetR family transcriptional regulator [Oceanobacillus zhaokaii]QGS67844.1 TetR family transcriptional regulator [Oceanobacillus sp. 143]